MAIGSLRNTPGEWGGAASLRRDADRGAAARHRREPDRERLGARIRIEDFFKNLRGLLVCVGVRVAGRWGLRLHPTATRAQLLLPFEMFVSKVQYEITPPPPILHLSPDQKINK